MSKIHVFFIIMLVLACNNKVDKRVASMIKVGMPFATADTILKNHGASEITSTMAIDADGKSEKIYNIKNILIHVSAEINNKGKHKVKSIIICDQPDNRKTAGAWKAVDEFTVPSKKK